jgi:predicted GH43/DUF377 family glycosyl hydrolase
LIKKHPQNPLINPEDIKPSMEGYKVLGAFNPGAINFGDEILLLMRVAEGTEPREGYIRVPTYSFSGGQASPDILEFKKSDPDLSLKDTRGVTYQGKDFLSTMSHIRLARSLDGVHFAVEDQPFIYPLDESQKYGVEDARVTFIEGRYYINYTVVSEGSWATALAVTDDFITFQSQGVIFHPENKDVAIFPERVNGKYLALHRPNNSGFGKPSIWYAESPDLLHWGNHKRIIVPRDNQWESVKIGGGAPPIKTPQGWLIIYHGKGDGSVYSLFCLLLDLDDPTKVIRRASTPLLTPTEPYETEGFFPNVVFSNGIAEKDGKLYIYYGAADESCCLAVTEISSLLSSF